MISRAEHSCSRFCQLRQTVKRPCVEYGCDDHSYQQSRIRARGRMRRCSRARSSTSLFDSALNALYLIRRRREVAMTRGAPLGSARIRGNRSLRLVSSLVAPG